MSRATFNLSPDLISQLAAATRGSEDERDRFVEEAIAEKLKKSGASEHRADGLPAAWKPFPDGKTFYDMTKDACGIFEGPGDLSTNPKHMEGFGEE